MAITLSCDFCKKHYTAKPYVALRKSHFCSRKCKSLSQEKQTEMSCEFCGAAVIGKPARFFRGGNKKVYCSRACHGLYRSHNKTRSRFECGKTERDVVVYGNACVICGFDRYVEFAHIIPVRRGGTIHPSNIIPLCPNHHRLFDAKQLNKDEDAALDYFVIEAWANPLAAKFPEISSEPSDEQPLSD